MENKAIKNSKRLSVSDAKAIHLTTLKLSKKTSSIWDELMNGDLRVCLRIIESLQENTFKCEFSISLLTRFFNERQHSSDEYFHMRIGEMCQYIYYKKGYSKISSSTSRIF